MRGRSDNNCEATPRRHCGALHRSYFLLVLGILPLLLSVADAAAEEGESAVPALMNLLKSGRVPPERVGTVVELIAKQGNAYDLGYVFEQALSPDGFSGKTRLEALEYLAAATESRGVTPKADLTLLGRLIDPEAKQQNRRLTLIAVRLAGLWRVPSAAAPLQTIALDDGSDPRLRRTAIESLMQIGGQPAKETAEKLASADFPQPLRFLGVAGMAELDLDRAATLAVGVLGDASSEDDPAPMIAAFLDHKSGPDKLAAAVAAAKIPVDAAKRALRYMYSVGRSDEALSAALSKAAGIEAEAKPLTEEEVKQLIGEVLAAGDPVRGEEVFRRPDVSCMKCHAVSKAGGDVGPDLSALGSSSPVDYVLKSILFPNQAVKEQYRASVVITTRGKVYTGIVKDRNEERIVLKEATGRERIIPAAEIEVEEEGKSLMPQGLTKFLTHRELVDLARFLSELGKPGPYAIPTTPAIHRWRVLVPAEEQLIAAARDDVAFRENVLEADESQWTPAYAKVNGMLPLNELSPGARGGVLYLKGEIDVSETGRVVVEIDSADGLHVWIDDEAFGSQEKIETNLSRGRHTITLRVDTDRRESQEVKVRVVKAAGQAAEFTVVGGP